MKQRKRTAQHQYLSGDNDRFARAIALATHHFLRARHIPRVNFDAEITTCHHDTVRHFDDRIDLLYRVRNRKIEMTKKNEKQ
jgi:hypothetical protein